MGPDDIHSLMKKPFQCNEITQDTGSISWVCGLCERLLQETKTTRSEFELSLFFDTLLTSLQTAKLTNFDWMVSSKNHD